jgi:hypothetical protein
MFRDRESDLSKLREGILRNPSQEERRNGFQSQWTDLSIYL